MQKTFIYFIFCLFVFNSSLLIAQERNKKVTLRLRVNDTCKLDSMRLFAWTGIQVEPLATAGQSYKKAGAEFQFNLENVPYGNYYIGTELKNMRPLLIDEESKIIMNSSNCLDANTYRFEKSDLNIAFVDLLDSLRIQGSQFFSIISSYQQNIQKPEVLKDLDQKLEAIDFRRKKLLLDLEKKHPSLAKIAALYTYVSYQNNRKEGQREGDYLGSSYFQFAQLDDVAYMRLPFFYESVKSYATNLTKVGLQNAEIIAYLDRLLKEVGENNPHHQAAVLAVAFGLLPSKAHQPLFLQYAKRYQQMHGGKNKVLDQFLQQQIVKIQGAAPIGGEAPNFTALTPEGKELAPPLKYTNDVGRYRKYLEYGLQVYSQQQALKGGEE